MSKLIVTSQFNLTNSDHSTNIAQNLRNSFQTGDKTDVAFICQNQRVLWAHRVVLAAASPFFRYLLENGDPYNDVYISMESYEYGLLEKLVAFLYCGEVYLSHEEEHSFAALVKEFEIWSCNLVEVEQDLISPTTLMDVIRTTVFDPAPELSAAGFNSLDNLLNNEVDMDCEATSIPPEKSKTKSTSIQCKTCGQVFNTRTGLRTHLMIHKGEKPFSCEVCSKSFRQASHLKTHLRVHTGEKPFKCDICDRGFSHAGSLNEHKNLHSKDKPYKCDVCQRSFAQRKALRVHHCGENPEDTSLTFPCPHCPRSFANRRGLAIHRMHQHADSEPLLQCEKCNKTFSNEMSYEEHLLTQCE